MKILELRFKNLNSLQGEWLIDFTHPDYVNSGIFAMIGPTGAGKTTILDAICLALYAQTPRLGKITASTNEIMSRQTGECFSQVLFESQKGRFRCRWDQRRARKKADGALQADEHQIICADTNVPIETKKSQTLKAVIEKTGMDFDRFTRSVLLAQGGFDSFLKAKVDEKSEILEQLTGTEIYTEISKKTHERQRSEKDILSNLQAQIGGIELLDNEKIASLKEILQDKEKENIDRSKKLEALRVAIQWFRDLDAIATEIQIFSLQKESIEKEIFDFSPQKERLSQAMRAGELEGDYQVLDNLKKQKKDAETTLATKTDEFASVEIDFLKKEENLKIICEKLEESRKFQMKLKPIWQKVRSLDQSMEAQKNSLKTEQESFQNLKKQAQEIVKSLDEVNKNKERIEKEMIAISDYLQSHHIDEWLLANFSAIEAKVQVLKRLVDGLNKKKSETEKIEKAIAQKEKESKSLQTEVQTLLENVKKIVSEKNNRAEELLKLLDGRTLKEYRFEKESLIEKKYLLQEIASYEERRKSLKDEKPCPLCGSLHHPYAQGNIPSVTETETRILWIKGKIQGAETLEEKIQSLGVLENEKKEKLNQLNQSLQRSVLNFENLLRQKEDNGREFARKEEEIEAFKKEFLEFLLPLKVTSFHDFSVENLKMRLDLWKEKTEKNQALQKQMQKEESELIRLKSLVKTHDDLVKEKEKQVFELQSQWDITRQEREELYKEKSPDQEEKKLENEIDQLQINEKLARKNLDDFKEKRGKIKISIDEIKDQILRLEKEIQSRLEQFLPALQVAGFFSQDEFLNARMTSPQRNDLSSKEESLKNRLAQILGKLEEYQKKLEELKAKNLSEKPQEELFLHFTSLEKQIQTCQAEIHAIRHQLTENERAMARIREKQEEIEKQKRECIRWDRLHELIGSADGKKFRTFAQGLTFEMMISHANFKLKEMNDRYLLIRDLSEPLELNVVDNYQAGEIRSVKNLSGGECFLVSLSLALGLSMMSSKNVQVDSLFLDEGFGTLDEEALENALETLSGLHQDGKLIGIISHVSALKERISTQIQIEPASGGKSIIYGPGCQRIDA